MTSLTKIKKEYGPVHAALLKKQCEIAGVNVKKIDFSNRKWYMNSTWTDRQEQRYKKWFINYLYGNLKRVREIARFAPVVYKNKKKLAILWDWWNLDYGFRRSDNEKKA